MFEVTAKATEMIKENLKDHEKVPSLRVILNEGG